MAVGFVLISTEPGREIEVRDAVSKVPSVSGQWIVFGIHDLFVKVEADDEGGIVVALSERIDALVAHLTGEDEARG